MRSLPRYLVKDQTRVIHLKSESTRPEQPCYLEWLQRKDVMQKSDDCIFKLNSGCNSVSIWLTSPSETCLLYFCSCFQSLLRKKEKAKVIHAAVLLCAESNWEHEVMSVKRNWTLYCLIQAVCLKTKTQIKIPPIFTASSPLSLHISALCEATSSHGVSIKTAGMLPHSNSHSPLLHNWMLTLSTTKAPCSFLNPLQSHLRPSAETITHSWAQIWVFLLWRMFSTSSRPDCVITGLTDKLLGIPLVFWHQTTTGTSHRQEINWRLEALILFSM